MSRIELIIKPVAQQLAQPWDLILRTPSDPDRRYVRVLHDWEPGLRSMFNLEPRQKRPNYEQYAAMPATRPLDGETQVKPSDFILMHESWQRRQLELMIWASRGQAPMGEVERWVLVQEKEKLITVPKGTKGAYPLYQADSILGAYQYLFLDHAFLSDGHAWNTYNDDGDPRSGFFRDYVIGLNLWNPIPWAQKSLTMTGNVHTLIENTAGMTPAQVSTHYKVEALNGLEEAPPLDYLLNEKRHLIIAATEQTVERLPDKTWQVSRFWHLKKWGVGTPYFMLAKKPWNLIKKIFVEFIGPDQRYSPYNPVVFAK